MADLEPGAEFVVPYPFVREVKEIPGPEGMEVVDGWKPGTENEHVPPDDCEAVADAMGKQVLTVVSTHKPGRFPLRVFYTRRWEAPDGRRFGKTNCRITTAQAFRRLVAGFRYQFRLRERSDG